MTNNSQLSYGLLESLLNHMNDRDWIAPPGVFQILRVKDSGSKNLRSLVTDGQYSIPSLTQKLTDDSSDPNDLQDKIVRFVNYSFKLMKGKFYLLVRSHEILGKGEPKQAFNYPSLTPDKQYPDGIEIFSYTTSVPNQMGHSASNSTSSSTISETRETKNLQRPESRKQSALYTPIKDVSPFSSKWCIRGRVVNKSPIRHYKSRAGNEGKLFNVTFLDETGEIRATGFNETVDQFYNLLELENIFTVSGARIVPANKNFSNGKHDYEITLDRGTKIERCNDISEDEIPQIAAEFVTLDNLGDTAPDSIIDVIGVVQSSHDVQEIQTKAGKALAKRDLFLVDKSSTSVRVTIWGDNATSFNDSSVDHVVVMKGVKVSDFGGRSLSLLSSGQLIYEPKLDEAFSLQGWYDSNGRNNTFTSAGSNAKSGATLEKEENRLTLEEVEKRNVGLSDKPEWFVTCASFSSLGFRQRYYYPACGDCNKKVVEETDSSWRCEKCNIVMEKPVYRYSLGMTINDYTGQIWVTGFEDVGQKVIGMSANELQDYEINNTDMFEQIIENFDRNDYLFRIKATSEVFNNVPRVRFQIMNLESINFSTESERLIKEIHSY